jgi:dihydroorotase
MTFDLVVSGARLFDPARGLDHVRDIGFRNGRIAEIGKDLAQHGAARLVQANGLMALPGLIDFRAHVYWGGTSLGVDADSVGRRSGTTTFVDAGSAGAGNMPGFVKHVIERSETRILAYINVSFAGIFGFSKEVMVGECQDLRLLNAREAVRVARDFPAQVVGVKARVGFNAGGSSGAAPLDIAIEIAEELDLPVMAHIDFPPPSRDEVLARLRPGDILTHCFRPFPNAPIDGRGKVRDTILKAHQRGVLFDIGHGYGGFAFKPGKAALDQGLMPDILSSDVHVLSVDGPAYDVLNVMSKFLALGMPLDAVVKAVTTTPAKAMRRPDLGTLAVDALGDMTLVSLVDEPTTYIDAMGERFTGTRKFRLGGVVLRGQWWDKAVIPGEEGQEP